MDANELTEIFVKYYRWSEEPVKLALRARFKCEYCGRDFLASANDYDSWQVDHIIPTSKGGGDEFDNKAASCKTCNFIKKNWLPDDFSQLTRKEKIERVKRFIASKRAIKENEVMEMREAVEDLLWGKINA